MMALTCIKERVELREIDSCALCKTWDVFQICTLVTLSDLCPGQMI